MEDNGIDETMTVQEKDHETDQTTGANSDLSGHEDNSHDSGLSGDVSLREHDTDGSDVAPEDADSEVTPEEAAKRQEKDVVIPKKDWGYIPGTKEGLTVHPHTKFQIVRNTIHNGLDYAPDSPDWESGKMFDQKRTAKSFRRDELREKTTGARIGGISITPRKVQFQEKSYDYEYGWPIKRANMIGVVRDTGTNFLRMPPEMDYIYGDDVRMCPGPRGSAPSSDDVLKNLDACRDVFDVQIDEELLDRVSLHQFGPGLMRDKSKHPTLEAEIPDGENKKFRNTDLNYGYVREFNFSPVEACLEDNVKYVDTNAHNLYEYYGCALGVNLVRNYEMFWPQFPYISKDHPNRFHENLNDAIISMFPTWAFFGNDTLARGWNAIAQEYRGDARIPANYYGHGLWQTPFERKRDPVPTKVSALQYIKIPAFSYISWSWAVHTPEKNVALVMGKNCHNIFALDIDIPDRKIMEAVIRILEREIGLSPFIRVGQFPKVALLYRARQGVVIKSKSMSFGMTAETRGDADFGAIEILGEGKPLTAYGVHHRMRSCFQWIGTATPAEDCPDVAPVITAEDIARFIDAVSCEVSILPGYNSEKTITRRVGGEFVETARPHGEAAEYYRGDDGIVLDGRFKYFQASGKKIIWRNASAIRHVLKEKKLEDAIITMDMLTKGVLSELETQVFKAFETYLKQTMSTEGDRWTDDYIRHQFTGLFSFYLGIRNAPGGLMNASSYSSGRNTKPKPVEVRRFSTLEENRRFNNGDMTAGVVVGTETAAALADDDDAAIDSNGDLIINTIEINKEFKVERRTTRETRHAGKTRIIDNETFEIKPPEAGVVPIALPGPEQAEMISHTLGDAIEDFLLEMYSQEKLSYASQDDDYYKTRPDNMWRDIQEKNFIQSLDAPEENRLLTVVDAPTGSGKTSRTIEKIVRDPRTLEKQKFINDDGEEEMGVCPVVIAMPTYANIDEAISRARMLCLDDSLEDPELIDKLMEQECFPDRDEAMRRLPEVRSVIRQCGRDKSLPPLNIQIYTGREQAGCPFSSYLSILANAHQPADRLCRAEITEKNDNGEIETREVLCERYNDCAYILQKQRIQEAHIVFIPHAFVSNGGLPKCLKRARALIIDEQIHNEFLRTSFMSVKDLSLNPSIFKVWKLRDELTEEERAKYVEHNRQITEKREMLPLRDWAMSAVLRAVRQKKDAALDLLDNHGNSYFSMEKWRELERKEQERRARLADTSNRYRIDENGNTVHVDIDNDDKIAIRSHGVGMSDEDKNGAWMLGCIIDATAIPDVHNEGKVLEGDAVTQYLEENDCVSMQKAVPVAYEFVKKLFIRDMRVRPNIKDATIFERMTQGGIVNAETEQKMWEVIMERMEAIKRIRTARDLSKQGFEDEIEQIREMGEHDDRIDVDKEIARLRSRREKYYEYPEKDARFQFILARKKCEGGEVWKEEQLRFSYRAIPGWTKTPVMLLDASAHPEIIAKVFKGRPIAMKKVVADQGKSLNMKIVGVMGQTFSNSSLVSSKEAMPFSRMSAAINLTNIRDALIVTSANHANSRVVFGASKTVREAIITGWQEEPETLDSCHFGAMRGIDAYKMHNASVCVGRMEPPMEAIDAYAACFSYDDDDYEEPFNIHGNGCADESGKKPLFQSRFPREIRMRNGGKAIVQTPQVNGKWGRIVQNQIREEEIIQFIGRLRPVYRKENDVPTCYVLSSIIPAHLIVDDIMTMEDYIGTDGKTNVVSPKKYLQYASPEYKAEKERKYAMTCVLRTVEKNKGVLWPEQLMDDEFINDIPKKYRDIDRLYALLDEFGFSRYGANRDEGMASGWNCISLRDEKGDDMEHLWTKSAYHEKARDSTIFLARYADEYFENTGDPLDYTEYPPKPAMTCFTREKDSVDDKARSGYKPPSKRKGVMTPFEEGQAEAEANAEVTVVREDFARDIQMLVDVPVIVQEDGCFRVVELLRCVNRSSGDIPLYRISDYLFLKMMPGSDKYVNPLFIADMKMAKARSMTLEQIYSLFALQQIYAPILRNICKQIRDGQEDMLNRSSMALAIGQNFVYADLKSFHYLLEMARQEFGADILPVVAPMNSIYDRVEINPDARREFVQDNEVPYIDDEDNIEKNGERAYVA